MSQTAPNPRPVERDPIPFSRVQDLVRALLGSDDLRQIRSLTLHNRAVEVEVYALNAEGHRYIRGGDEVAVDRIHIPISRTADPEGV